ncbi:endonuclease V [Acanthamoeba castellanii medusavirus]|uniref:Endonuclease V n=1 Tax=Acanthamoeba castellanii medusavirus J1 TaxID=3114988 RepID=A0A3T1CXH4_9VIRU|nr:endonuclease V [Acanthamoeba castellanii medusavirus]BBI30521.1 endonuclease V [Acanthamoeba castellanii medusavirus J1]
MAEEQRWEEEQRRMKDRLVTSDAFDPCVRYVGGVDISFVKGDAVSACASLVVLAYPSLELVWSVERMVAMELPYISGFLAFREAPHLARLIDHLRAERPDLEPQVLFVDGNGILHPRGFGLASHLGVLSGIPTIGVAKTFLHVDGLDARSVKSAMRDGRLPLVGSSGTEWGVALKSTKGSTNPIYVSVGHRVSLASAETLTAACCRHRVPEPIRQADL